MKLNLTKVILLFFISMLTVGAWGAPDKDYLCIKAEVAGATVHLIKNGGSSEAVNLEYTTNGSAWADFVIGTTEGCGVTLANVGDKVYLRNKKEAKYVTTFSKSITNFYSFTFENSVSVSGNIMSLIDKNVESTTIPCDWCFNNLFGNSQTLTSAADLKLPATTLAKQCYLEMFNGCTALTAAPAILPATTLATSCYQQMFYGCTALETAPKLPATTLATSCYQKMFYGCTKLKSVKVGFTKWGDLSYSGATDYCATYLWLNDAGKEATNPTFECPAELDTETTRDIDHVPEGWTIKKIEPMRDYLCIKAEEAGAKVQLTKKGSPEAVTIEYSTDEGATWTTVDFSTVVTTGDITLTNVGDKVYFRNNGTSATFSQSANNYYQFVMSGNVAASGNVMSLIDNNVESATIPCNYCFYGLFAFCKTLTNAADLKLPATTLTGRCYSNMFEFCSALTTAPALPAKTLKEHCYFYMFSNCHSLEKAPELPAETLESSSYGCMFNDCHKLNYVRVGFTEWGFNATGKWLCDAGTEATNHDFACPEELNVNTRDDDHVPEGWTITHPLLDYLCITAEEADATVQLIKNGGSSEAVIEYSTNNGANWTKVDFSEVTTTGDIKLESVGHKVYFRNASEATEVTEFSHNSSYYYFTFSKKVSASGNVMSLIDKKVKTTKIMQHCFNHLFYNCDNLINAANLKLPATTLAGNCYSNMFEGCKNLTTAPALPATTLGYECYYYMFSGCTALTTAPALPATTLASSCYQNMFNGCTALKTAPALPATTLAENCYQNMFNGCTTLTTAPALPAKELEDYCYDGMFKSCTALATSIELPAEKLKKHCYNEMFYDCKKLNHVKVGFTKWGNMDDKYSEDYEATHSWLASTGEEATDREFVCPEGLDVNTLRDYSHVPSRWTITRTSLDYLCITAEEDDALVELKKSDAGSWNIRLEYSTDNGVNWTQVGNVRDEFIPCSINLEKKGKKVYLRNAFRFEKEFSKDQTNYYHFTFSKKVSASGNVMSLIDKYMDSTTIPCNYCFTRLFRDCTNLMNVANLKLPATTLAEDCYNHMFYKCSTLETAPALPATTLAKSC
ncbi:MAG: hypothetical protein KBS65_03010 [Prevotella sp.]|nr:hypothetical protein [Candidatus Equicola stercoris]